MAISEDGELILCVNGSNWLTSIDTFTNPYAIDVTPFMKPGETNTIDIWFTGSVFPFHQQVRAVSLEM